ncbi:Zn-ribbon domain-containing OB-fold protein [Microvirga makkahensis]|uniref:DNA-binding protein n=1 Tax=Microvirga makkahensis TaxID=1128670 RepID=A0A7X3SQQ5_9HYPH|nr:OB-fold domain-containing protein [Microvirga makkahensis]MXQ13518.1 DNA-binding protein [Microvirga makkahensis]
MSEILDYPRPHEDEDNRPFLEAWREGRLMLQQSRSGGPPFFYPRPICPYTGSTDLVWKEASGRGRIVSFSIVMRPNHPSFNDEVPIILAEIALEEGASLLARVITSDASAVTSGTAVELMPRPEAARYPLPTFRLAA